MLRPGWIYVAPFRLRRTTGPLRGSSSYIRGSPGNIAAATKSVENNTSEIEPDLIIGK